MQNHISIKTFIAIKTCIKPLLAAAIALFLLPQLALPSQASDLTYKTEYYRPPTPPFTRIPRSANSGAFVTLRSYRQILVTAVAGQAAAVVG